MRVLGIAAGACALLGAFAAAAMHPVTSPEMFARRHVMQIIGEQATILEAMASGRMPFDPRVARIAAGEISEYARQLPGLYEAEAMQDKSEALRSIRESFGEFTTQSMRLAKLAEAACEEIESLDDLRTANEDIQETCLSCHDGFRNRDNSASP